MSEEAGVKKSVARRPAIEKLVLADWFEDHSRTEAELLCLLYRLQSTPDNSSYEFQVGKLHAALNAPEVSDAHRESIMEQLRIAYPGEPLADDLLINQEELQNFIHRNTDNPIQKFLVSFQPALADDHPLKTLKNTDNKEMIVARAEKLREDLKVTLPNERPHRYNVTTKINNRGLNIALQGIRVPLEQLHFYGLHDIDALMEDNIGFYPIHTLSLDGLALSQKGVCDAFKMAPYATCFEFAANNVIGHTARLTEPLEKPQNFEDNQSVIHLSLHHPFNLKKNQAEAMQQSVANFVLSCQAAEHVTLAGKVIPPLVLADTKPMPKLRILEFPGLALNKRQLEAALDSTRFPNLQTVRHRPVRDQPLVEIDVAEERKTRGIILPAKSSETVGEYYERLSDVLKTELAQGLDIDPEALGKGNFAEIMRRLSSVSDIAIKAKRQERGAITLSGLVLRTALELPFADPTGRPTLIPAANKQIQERHGVSGFGTSVSGKIIVVENQLWSEHGNNLKMSPIDAYYIGKAIRQHLPELMAQLPTIAEAVAASVSPVAGAHMQTEQTRRKEKRGGFARGFGKNEGLERRKGRSDTRPGPPPEDYMEQRDESSDP